MTLTLEPPALHFASMSDAPQEPSSAVESSPSQPSLEVPARRRRDRDGDGEDDNPEAARKRLLLVIPLVMAAAAIAALVLGGMQDKGVYSRPVDQLVAEYDWTLARFAERGTATSSAR